jgi:cell division septation protein DedD
VRPGSPPPASLPPGESLTCPRCAAPCEASQEYCLECGLRLPAAPAGLVASLGGAWRRRLPWYPGDWIWLALALLAVAALGAAVAIFASRETPGRRTIVATTAPGPTAAARRTTAPAVTAPTRTQPPPAATRPSTTTPARRPAPRPRRLVEWPTGRGGWTVVLRSDVREQMARNEARRALGAGVRDVGILDSSDYTSLHPGYYVVFAGVHDSQGDAEGALEAARSRGYERAYVRQVSP